MTERDVMDAGGSRLERGVWDLDGKLCVAPAEAIRRLGAPATPTNLALFVSIAREKAAETGRELVVLDEEELRPR